jgi:hypothetical protein
VILAIIGDASRISSLSEPNCVSKSYLGLNKEGHSLFNPILNVTGLMLKILLSHTKFLQIMAKLSQIKGSYGILEQTDLVTDTLRQLRPY